MLLYTSHRLNFAVQKARNQLVSIASRRLYMCVHSYGMKTGDLPCYLATVYIWDGSTEYTMCSVLQCRYVHTLATGMIQTKWLKSNWNYALAMCQMYREGSVWFPLTTICSSSTPLSGNSKLPLSHREEMLSVYLFRCCVYTVVP